MVLIPAILTRADANLNRLRTFWSVDMERPRPLEERKRLKWVRPKPVCQLCRGQGWKALLKHPKRIPAGAILTHRGFEVGGEVVIPSMQKGRMSCPACCAVTVAEMDDKKLRRLGARWGVKPAECLRRQAQGREAEAAAGWHGKALDRMNVRLKCPVRFRESRWLTADWLRRAITVTGISAFEPYEIVTVQVVLPRSDGRAVRDLVAERLRAEVFTILVYPLWERWAEGAD